MAPDFRGGCDPELRSARRLHRRRAHCRHGPGRPASGEAGARRPRAIHGVRGGHRSAGPTACRSSHAPGGCGWCS